jgi:hypothetical protein
MGCEGLGMEYIMPLWGGFFKMMEGFRLIKDRAETDPIFFFEHCSSNTVGHVILEFTTLRGRLSRTRSET